jgi:Bacterial SH3 domain
MIALSTEVIGFNKPVLLVVLIILVFGALECERSWTRSRRRRGVEPGALAYVLDGLMILGTVLVLVGIAMLFVEGLTSMASMIGGLIDGGRVGLLIVGMILALGLVLALARAARGRHAAQDSASARAVAQPSIYPAARALEAHLADRVEQPGYAPLQDRFDEQSVPALSMMQQHWQPSAAITANVPTSFLNLAKPPVKPQTRPRFVLASTFLILALVVVVISSTGLFRHQLTDILASLEASYGTAASLTTPLAATDVQGAQKRVKSNELNLRAQPGTEQQVVVVLKQGDIVTAFTDARLLQGATWIKVRAGDYEGWVDQSLLE